MTYIGYVIHYYGICNAQNRDVDNDANFYYIL